MDKRRITEYQEKIYRMVSGEFQGMRKAQAARELGITPRAVHRTLKRMKLQAPEMFPILNTEEAKLLELLRKGAQLQTAAKLIKISIRRVYKLHRSLINKKRWCKNRAEVFSLTDSLERYIVKRF
jgi:DNA-binding CsgD family transcriptional regulator